MTRRKPGKSTPPLARARVDYVLDDVVREIAARMRSCEWTAGPSHREYAARYGVTEDAVREWAAQASRHLRLVALEDPEEIRAEIVDGVRHVRAVALGKIRKFSNVKGDVIEYADPDCRSALSSLELLGKAYGALVERHEHNVNLTEMTEEQLLEELRKAGYEVTKKEANGNEKEDS